MRTCEYCPVGSALLNNSKTDCQQMLHIWDAQNQIQLFMSCCMLQMTRARFVLSFCAYQLSLQQAKQETTPETGLEALNHCGCLSKQRVNNKNIFQC